MASELRFPSKKAILEKFEKAGSIKANRWFKERGILEEVATAFADTTRMNESAKKDCRSILEKFSPDLSQSVVSVSNCVLFTVLIDAPNNSCMTKERANNLPVDSRQFL